MTTEQKCNGTTHYVCNEIMQRDGGKSVCCGCNGHECTPKKEAWEEEFDKYAAKIGILSREEIIVFFRTLIATERADAYAEGFKQGRFDSKAEVIEAEQRGNEKYGDIIQWVEGVVAGTAFSKESGFIWQHWLDKGKELLKEARTPNHKGTISDECSGHKSGRLLKFFPHCEECKGTEEV